MSVHPEVDGVISRVLVREDVPALLKQLGTVGFKPEQSKKAIEFLSKPSPFTTTLLSDLTPLDACMQYLIISTPECDLPQRFLPSINSSNSFVVGGHSGANDIKTRWLEDKLVKEAGWPATAVRETMQSNPAFAEDESSLVAALCKRLLGENAGPEPEEGAEEPIDPDELEALSGEYTDDGQLVVPLPIAPFKLHMFLSAGEMVPKNGPPMYISSSSVPAYIRLHLLNGILVAAANGTLMDPYETFLGACMRVVEEGWVDVEDNGPPNVSDVLWNLMPRRDSDPESTTQLHAPSKNTHKEPRYKRRDERTNAQVREEFDAICQDEKYQNLLKIRKRLPAFSAKDSFLSVLEKSRVVVVVGETGGSDFINKILKLC